MELQFLHKDCRSCECIDWRSKDLEDFPINLSACDSNKVQILYLDHNHISKIPDTLNGYWTSLHTVSLIGNELEYISPSIENIRNLKHLDLSENSIHYLPDSLGNLVYLETLKVIGNNLTNFPNSLGSLSNLKILQFEENFITTLPESLCNLCQLEVFEGNRNSLASLPRNFGTLLNLRVCVLNHNLLKEVPHTFGDLDRLELLDLSNNMICAMPSSCKFRTTLRRLYMENNELRFLPHWVNHLPQIIEINLRNNQINRGLTKSFALCNTRLKDVDFSANFFTKLPSNIGALMCLDILRLGSAINEIDRCHYQNGNGISKLPNSIVNLSTLRELHLDENRLTYLPHEVGHLESLELLKLGQNMLYSIPESFTRLRHMKQCHLAKNNLTSLPADFGNLVALEVLHLEHNHIKHLPDSMKDLVNIRVLDVFHNELESIPFSLSDYQHIVFLDIRENKFDGDIACPLHLKRHTYHAPRNPSLKDNWRGRRLIEGVQIKDNETFEPSANGENVEETAPNLTSKFSDKFLRHIAKNCLAYGDNQTVYSRSNYTPSWLRESTVKTWPETSYNERMIGAGIVEPVIDDDNEESSSETSESDTHSELLGDTQNDEPGFCAPITEDWDEEIKMLYGDQSIPVYQQIVNTSIDERFLFIPEDLHPPSFIKCPLSRVSHDGQFDDVV